MPIARGGAFDSVSSNAWHGTRTGSHGRKQIDIAWLESRRPPENEGGATGYHPPGWPLYLLRRRMLGMIETQSVRLTNGNPSD